MLGSSPYRGPLAVASSHIHNVFVATYLSDCDWLFRPISEAVGKFSFLWDQAGKVRLLSSQSAIVVSAHFSSI